MHRRDFAEPSCDNASSVAVVIEAARLLHTLPPAGYRTPAETVDRVETSTLVEATWLTLATVHLLTHGSVHR